MLVLSRKKGESVLIGDNIKLKVIDIQNNSVKIGIEAAKELTILREELLVEIEKENLKAVQVNLNQLDEVSKMLTDFKKDKKET